MNKDKWIWMPHPAHFCLAETCRFVLSTCVGNYIVSTVGECMEWNDPKKERPYTFGADGDRYETMVFPSVESGRECCPFRIQVSEEAETMRYKEAKDAVSGHMSLCEKYAVMDAPSGKKHDESVAKQKALDILMGKSL